MESDVREDEWLGRELRIGGFSMRVDERDSRCVIVNIDPTTLERSPSVLRALAQERSACIGVYGSCVSPGLVAVGDPVLLEP